MGIGELLIPAPELIGAIDPLQTFASSGKLDVMTAIDIPMPSSVWPYWLLAATVVIGFPVTSFVYFPALLQSGALPVDGDSISIPMFTSIALAVIMAPIISGMTYGCLRHYKSGATLFVWRRDRPAVSLVLSLIFGLPATMLILSIAQTATGHYPLIEFIWMPYMAVCVAWLMALRAAALSCAKQMH